jgi:hypothetical protein
MPVLLGLLSFKGTEVAENTTSLPDTSVNAFRVFVAFIYRHLLPPRWA